MLTVAVAQSSFDDNAIHFVANIVFALDWPGGVDA